MFRALTSLRSAHRRWLLAAALLLVLLPRVFVPVGYMPDQASPSALRMCPSGFPGALLAFSLEAQMASGAMDHMDPATHAAHMEHAGHPTASDAHCEFAALAAAGLVPAGELAVGVAPLVFLVAPLAAPPLARRPHLLPFARGPPSLS